MDSAGEVNMEYTTKELERMTKNELILHIMELYKSKEEFENTVKPKGTIIFSGSPKYVKDYYDMRMKEVNENSDV